MAHIGLSYELLGIIIAQGAVQRSTAILLASKKAKKYEGGELKYSQISLGQTYVCLIENAN